MRNFFWFVTAASSILGSLIGAVGVIIANGAPQQAASASIGISMAVIPYCFSRALSEMMRDSALPKNTSPTAVPWTETSNPNV